MSLKDYILKCRKLNAIRLFFDIETFRYNIDNAKENPTKNKNMVYSVAISFVDDNKIHVERFKNFFDFFNMVIDSYKEITTKKKPKILINAQNGNKYDNHFMRKDIMYYFHASIEDMFLLTATTEKTNKNALKKKDIKQKNALILEKRVKSKINLEMTFYLHDIEFQTEDNFIKTNASIKTLGEKLLKQNLIEEKHLKTDFNYTMYDKKEDMTDEEAKEYAEEIYNSLNEEQITYIENDVIILALSWLHYSKLFKNFDYSRITFTSNILAAYNTNDLTSLQLLNKIGNKKDKTERVIRYTDYKFMDENYYDFLKSFYRGGLNFYNQFYIGTIVKNVFSMDINSSYPYAMHNKKVPTFYHSSEEYEETTYIKVDYYNDDEYFLYRMEKKMFDNYILSKMNSIIIRQMLVKYYSTNDYININSYTLRMIEETCGISFNELPVLGWVKYECEFFGSRDKINEFYEIKTKGSNKYEVDYKNPYEIEILNVLNKNPFSLEEIYIAKTYLNGLYGIPALRAHFNVFRNNKDKKDFVNIENGHKNAERNIVFSIFVTSVSLWNLLRPLKFLSGSEVDDNFIYCDTDSLYLKKEVMQKIPKSFFSPVVLGKWDIQDDHIEKMYVLNHKKYCYTTDNKKIKVKSGGIPLDSFDKNMSFENFVKTQFSDGVEVNTLKSIYNETQTITLYETPTKLEIGKNYRNHSYDEKYDSLKKQIFDRVKELNVENENDVLYIESVIGTFSLSEISPFKNKIKDKLDLMYLELETSLIKKQLCYN